MAILPSRRIVGIFVGIFIIGMIVGGLLMTEFSDLRFSRFLNRTSDPTTMATRLNQTLMTDYQLSPEEEAKIEPLTREMAQHLYQVRRQFGVDFIAILDDYHRQIGEQMTPAHRAAYEKVNEERRKRAGNLLLLDPAPTAPSVK